jgi:predicted dehydrogenase
MTVAVRWGVLGCAQIAINHVLPAIKQVQAAQLVAVASRSLPKAERVAREFGSERAYGSYEALLADPGVEAVYIPLPNHLHRPWSIAALRAGKHVLCEKPIALNAGEAREMQSVARETGHMLLEAYAYRFGPVVQKAIAVCRAGTLGELRMLHSSLTFVLPEDPTNVRLQAGMGGGALYDVGCYALNVQRMLAGREPSSAWAKLSWSERFPVDVAGAGVLGFGGQLLGTFDFGFGAPGGSFLRAVGTAGKLEAPHGFASRPGEPALLLTVGHDIEHIELPEANTYAMEVLDLCEAIRGVHPPSFAWEPLDATMRVLDACFASDSYGRAVQV